MADAPNTGTSDTPPAASAAPAASPPSDPPAATTAAPETGSTAGPVETAKVEATPEAPKAEALKEPKAEEPLFILPEGFKPPEKMIKLFTDTLKGKYVDGKLAMSPQEVVNFYHQAATQANTDWQAQVQSQLESTDRANEATCRARFSEQQLASAQSAVGWASSLDPAFKEWATNQLNHPVFVNLMRIVGEAMQEDTLESSGRPPAPTRSRAQIMGYDKSN